MKIQLVNLHDVPDNTYRMNGSKYDNIIQEATKLQPGKAIKLVLDENDRPQRIQGSLTKRLRDRKLNLRAIVRGDAVFIIKVIALLVLSLLAVPMAEARPSFGHVAKAIALYPVHQVKEMAHDRNFLIGIAILGAAQFADGLTTDHLLRGCPGCYEQNPLFGRHPSTARIYGQGTALYLTETFAYWELRKRLTSPDPVHSDYRDAVFVGIAGQSIVHGILAKGNADLLVRARPAYLRPH